MKTNKKSSSRRNHSLSKISLPFGLLQVKNKNLEEISMEKINRFENFSKKEKMVLELLLDNEGTPATELGINIMNTLLEELTIEELKGL
jgi:hypothetical protein